MFRSRWIPFIIILLLGMASLSLLSVQAQEKEPPAAPRATPQPDANANASDAPADFVPPAAGSDPAAPPHITLRGGITVYTNRAAFTGAYPAMPYEDFEDTTCTNIQGFPAPLNAFMESDCFNPGSIPIGIEFRDNPVNEAGGSPNGLAIFPGGSGGLPEYRADCEHLHQQFHHRFLPLNSGRRAGPREFQQRYPAASQRLRHQRRAHSPEHLPRHRGQRGLHRLQRPAGDSPH